MKLLAIERRDDILLSMRQNGSVIVSDLSKRYGVTEETIRRDLEKLEEQGLVRKTYGGAVMNQNVNIDMPLNVRRRSNKELKLRIAERFKDTVEDGDTLMMDSSSTVLCAAQGLKTKRRLTVITNSVEMLADLSDVPDINVISSGGQLRKYSLSLVGARAERTIDGYNADRAVISCKGLHVQKGLTESNEAEADIKRAMMHASKEVILLADSTKFGNVSLVRIEDFARVSTVVTDREPDAQWLAFFAENGTRCIW